MSNEPMTLRQIAEIEGVSHQAIEQILERAMRKIKKILRSRGLTLEDIL